jgi:hypothetical protein
MSLCPRLLRVVGVHPVTPTDHQIRDAVAIMWGDGLDDVEQAEAIVHVGEHFKGLFLIEIEVQPDDAAVDWSTITQPIDGQPPENWQVPYDERRVDGTGGRWAFFFHYLDLRRPLSSPFGDLDLREPSPTPKHLRGVEYEVPG